MKQERDDIIHLISEARSNGARQRQACDIIGITPKTLQRWARPEGDEDGRLSAKHSPCNKLSELERQRIIQVCNQPEYANLSPSVIVPMLADKGVYYSGPLCRDNKLNFYDIVYVYPVVDKLKSVCELLATSFCCQWFMHTPLLELVWRSQNRQQVHSPFPDLLTHDKQPSVSGIQSAGAAFPHCKNKSIYAVHALNGLPTRTH